jgi:hypothetical protein
MRVVLIMCALVMALTVSLATAQPAQAGASCTRGDHLHDPHKNHHDIKHDRRYKYQSNGYIWVRWDVKAKNHRTGYFYFLGRVNVKCYAVDRADILEPSNLLTDPRLVMI